MMKVRFFNGCTGGEIVGGRFVPDYRTRFYLPDESYSAADLADQVPFAIVEDFAPEDLEAAKAAGFRFCSELGAL